MISQIGKVMSLRVSMTDYFNLTAEAGQNKVFLSDLLWMKISEHAELKTELEKSNTIISEEFKLITEERAAFENDILELRGMLEESFERGVALQNEVLQMKATIEDFSQLEMDKKILETEILELKERLSNVLEDNLNLEHSFTSTIRDIENHNITRDRISDELKILKNKNIELEACCKKSTQTANSLKTSFDSISEEKKTLKGVITSLQGDLKKATQKYEKQNGLFLEKLQDNKVLKDMLVLSQAETKKGTQKIISITLKLQNTEKENIGLVSFKDSLLKRNETLSKTVETLQDKRGTDVIEHNRVIDGLHRQVQSWFSYSSDDGFIFEDAKW